MKRVLTCGLVVILGFVLVQTRSKDFKSYRGSLEKSIAYVTDESESTGGTGFHVLAKSGQKYLVTNAHVCRSASKGKGVVYVRLQDEDSAIPRRVIQESPVTDLCLVEPLPLAVPISVAKGELSNWEEIAAVGHPKLMPLTLSVGKTIAPQTIQVLVAMFPPPGTCVGPKYKEVDVPVFIFMAKACIMDIASIATTVQVMPGSSGSPVIDHDGSVVGVVFAGDEGVGWGFMIPAKDLCQFLSSY